MLKVKKIHFIIIFKNDKMLNGPLSGPGDEPKGPAGLWDEPKDSSGLGDGKKVC